MDITINLLPWRQIKRNRERKKILIILSVAVMILMLGCSIWNYHIHQLINSQLQQNKLTRQKIIIFDQKIEQIKKLKQQREKLMERIVLLQKLKEDQSFQAHLFEELIKLIPMGSYLNSVHESDKKITIKGVSQFNNTIPLLMRAIEENPWMHEPNLIELKKSKKPNRELFILSFILDSKVGKLS